MTATARRAYGVGLAYRAEMHREIMAYAPELDLLEVNTDDYLVRARRVLMGDPDSRKLREALTRLPAVAHGISLSIGSVEPADDTHCRQLTTYLRDHLADGFSEHMTYHRLDGTDVMYFLCMPFEEASVRWLAAKYGQVRQRLGVPVALENVSYPYPIPGSTMTEPEFLTRLTEETDCSLLLDVTNVYNNAVNHGYDPVEFIRGLPGDRVSQMHLAGGHYSEREGMWIDSHNMPVMAPVWDLLHEALRHTAADVVILEKDSNYWPFDVVMADVRQARSIFYQHRPKKPAHRPAALPERTAEALEAALADPEVQQLRAFQRATIGVCSDPAAGQRWAGDAEGAARQFGLEGAWLKRWVECSRPRLEMLQRKWKYVDSHTQAEQKAYEEREWAAWAAEVGTD